VLSEADVPDTHWRLGNYEILEEIGRGGMGVIYRAQQRHSRRIVALKRIIAYQADSRETLVRFRREAEAAASLDHPNILPIYEVSESEDGLPFFSMKYATGGNLRAAISALHIKPNECVRLMANVARAISYAHGQGILHRDLQPGNILLDRNGEPMVSDFGLAKWLDENSDLTRTITTFGTPGYIAPEQAEDAAGNITPAADIYSLGAILFHLLAGRPPFVGANVFSVIHQAAATSAPRLRSLAPSLDRDLETILARSLERDPKSRYQTAGALADDLERWLEGRPILARRVLAPARMWHWGRRNPVLAGATTTCLVLIAAVVWLLRGQFAHPPELPPSEKSIAVLPFENFSDNKENSEFAAGIQDDLLTSLAQIHELKVISRTSVMAYPKRDRRNMREIGRALGVANVLEGSVRRTGNRVLVNVQLIDARNGRHVWAERYDRTVADSIGLQGELATQIAATLKATLAPDEKARLDAEPTANSEAYVLYLTALGKEATDWEAAEQLHVQAAAIDPKFALAYAHASILNSWFFPERKAKARAQAEEALRLSPKVGEGHVALGLCLYVAEKKYDAALKEFEIAAATSPNNADIYKYVGGIYRRQGRWRDAVANSDRAISLDPLNPDIAQFAANNHLILRDWVAAAAGSTRTLEIKPESIGARCALAYLEVFRNGNPAAGTKLLQNIPPGMDPYNRAALTRWDLAMLERDYAAAERLSSDLPELPPARIGFPKSFYQARTALARGDMEAARRYFAATTPVLEARVRDHPDDAYGHSWLGILYGYMRRKEDAIRESRRAVELEPESRDAFHGAQYSASLALVYALVGEKDAAMTLIERLLSTPGAVWYPDFPHNMTLADLRLRWEWDSLRSNPRFQKIVAGPEPKTNLTSIPQWESMGHLAIIYASTGQKDIAIEQVAATLQIPSPLNYGYLRLHPFWGPAAGRSALRKIVAELAPKRNFP
jgi:serine/threonine protein kinase/tetratricopeptide (TPR) repeat protein